MASERGPRHQLTSELPAQDGRRGVVISASKEIEPGVRAMLVEAKDLFRLDVIIAGDTLRTIVRNHSGGELRMRGGVYGAEGANAVFGEAAIYEPARTATAFTLGSGGDAVDVDVTFGTLRFAERGTIRISAQAIVRQAS